MIIKELRIGSFAGIENKVINFENGMNIIYGDNEAGKSRIETFIKAMLYGLSSKRIKKDSERKKYISFNSDTAYGEMVVSHNKKEYLIKRKFGSSKKNDSSEVLDFLTGEKIDYINSDEPGRYFLEINKSTFEKTLYIGQLSVSFHKDKEEEIMDKVTALYGCGDHEVSGEKAMEKLEALKKSYVTVRGTGNLDLLKKKYDAIQQERYDSERIAEKNMDWEKELIDCKADKNKIKSEIENLEVYKKYLKKVKLQKEYKEIVEYFKESEKLKNQENELMKDLSKDNKVIDEEFLNKISEENLEYQRLLNTKEEVINELKEYEEIYKDKNNEFERYKFIDLFGDNLKDRLLQIKYEQQSFEEKINSSKEIKNLIEDEENELESKRAIFNMLNEDMAYEIKQNLDLYEIKLKDLKETAYSKDDFLEHKEKNTEKFKMVCGALICLLGIVLFFIKLINVIVPIIVIIAGTGLWVYSRLNYNKLKNARGNRIQKLTSDINSIEKYLESYRKELRLNSSEELIKYIKKYMMFKQYEEKMIIRIEEKKRILNSNNYEELRNKYDKNNEMIKNLIRVSNCKSINEVLDCADKFTKLKSELEVIEEKREIVRISLSDIEENINKKSNELKAKLKVLGEFDMNLLDIDVFIGEYREKIRKRDELHSNLKSVEQTYNVLVKDRDINKIKDDLKDIIKLDKSYEFESEEEIEKEEKIKSKALIECEKNIKDIENNINTRLIGKRRLVEIEEELEDVSKKINSLERKLKALNLAIDILKESIDEVRKTIGPALNKGVENVFSSLTECKYGEIKLDNNYEMMVRGKNDLIKGSYLSNGAFDQLYLALRIALIEMLFKDEECSIILDDAFVQYDNRRREAALKLINDRIKGQALIFTCHPIEKELMIKNDIDFNYVAI